MWREEGDLLTKGIRTLDLGLTAAAFITAYFTKKYLPYQGYGGLSTAPNYYLLLLALLVSSGMSYDFFRLYVPLRQQTLPQIFLNILKGVITGMTVVVLFFYLFKIQDVSRLFMCFFVGYALLFLGTSRVLAWGLLVYNRSKGLDGKDILLVGSRDRARAMIQHLKENDWLGLRIIGCLEVDPKLVGTEVCEGVTVLGSLNDFEKMLLDVAVDEVIFAMPLKRIDNVCERIAFAENLGVKVRILPDWQLQKLMYRPEIAEVRLETLAGIPTMALSSTPNKGVELMLKQALDRVAAAAGLIVLSPLFGLLAVLIKVGNPGPVFFRQERSGLNGRIFTLYKFRTMVVNAEAIRDQLMEHNEMDGPVFKLKKDPRVTKIGAFLRKTSLDELPQLINVLRGEMSLVGPRPPLPEEVRQYHPWQRRRLSMRPGLTCIWQVSGRNQISFEQWMRMDLEYIDKWSLFLDIKLLFKTVPAVIFGTGH